jgi:hypothetical protein
MTWLFSVTILLGAALLFTVQPMIGKMVLPRLGGAPAVWTACMLFFQATLLAGYLYAHALSKLRGSTLGRWWQVGVHAVALLLPVLVLPMALPAGWAPAAAGASPTIELLKQLALSVALPVVMVSTTGPLLQRWFSLSGARGAGDPYFLFVASNLGSFAGLLAYPFVIEPFLDVREQSRVWAVGFGVYALLVLACGVAMVRGGARGEAGSANGNAAARSEAEAGSTIERRPVTWGRRLLWLALAAVPTSLMLGTTQHLSTDVAAAPLLWVVPLALYLLTFVVAFSSWRLPTVWLGRGFVLAVLALGGMAAWKILGTGKAPIQVEIGLNLVVMFVGALVLHARLAQDRPEPSRLTEFYLVIAAGGVVGGLFNALLAPVMFSGVLEYPVAMAAAALMRPGTPRVPPAGWRRWASAGLTALWPLLVLSGGLLAIAMVLDMRSARAGSISLDEASVVVVATVIGLTLLAWRSRVRLGLSIMAVFLVIDIAPYLTGGVWYRSRTFFGVHRVSEVNVPLRMRVLYHGTTTHGAQGVTPNRELDPTPLTYYDPNGPVGHLLRALESDPRRSRVAVVGLGTGSVAAYARPGDQMTFFEIDPAVVSIALDPRLFSFMNRAGKAAEVVLGDARLTLASRPDSSLGVLFLDAFSSDAVPAHLISREALAMYFRKLAPGGVAMVHISNRMLDLEPVLAAGAAAEGLVAMEWFDEGSADRSDGHYPSQWVLLARRSEDLATVLRAPGAGWGPIAGRPGFRAWTDEYSNLLSIIRWR